MWSARKFVWNRIAIMKFRANKPATIPVPKDDGRKLEAVGLASQFPNIPVPNIRVADHVPADEASALKSTFYDGQVALYSGFAPMEAGPASRSTRIRSRRWTRPTRPATAAASPRRSCRRSTGARSTSATWPSRVRTRATSRARRRAATTGTCAAWRATSTTKACTPSACACSFA